MTALLMLLSGLAMASDEPNADQGEKSWKELSEDLGSIEKSDPKKDRVKFAAIQSTGGHFMVTHVTDFPVDAEGNRFGKDSLIHYRSRPGFTVGNSKVSFATQWDIFTGHTFDRTWDVPGTADARRRHEVGLLRLESFKPRRASVKALLPGAEVEVGLVTSHWA